MPVNNQLPAPPKNQIDAILQARQAAAAAEQSAAFCQHQTHVLESTLRENTDAYMAAIRKCQQAAARADHSAQVVRICTIVIVALNLATLALCAVRLLQ